LHNDELVNLYSSANIIGVIKSRKKRCSTRGKDEKSVTLFFVRKPKGKRPFGELCGKWEYSTEIDLKEIIGCESMN
jgi:hypothetical protein